MIKIQNKIFQTFVIGLVTITSSACVDLENSNRMPRSSPSDLPDKPIRVPFNGTPKGDWRIHTIKGSEFCTTGHKDLVIEINPNGPTTGIDPGLLQEAGEGKYYLLEKLSNQISILDDTKLTVFADIGTSRDPYSLAVTEDELWTPNYISNTVSVVSRKTGKVIKEISSNDFKSPSGIFYLKPWIFVTNIHYGGGTPPLSYGPGTITIIDQSTKNIIKTIPTLGLNPLKISRIEGAVSKQIAIVNSGAIEFTPSNEAYAATPGSVEIWDLENGLDHITKNSIELPLPPALRTHIGGINSFAQVGNHYYFSSSTASLIFELENKAGTLRWVHGSSPFWHFDPNVPLKRNSLNRIKAFKVDGETLLGITSFNSDAFYLIDPSCNKVIGQPIPINKTSNLEGTSDFIIKNGKGYFVRSLAQQLTLALIYNKN